MRSKSKSMADGFRVRCITIEGFKGFTQPKEIDLRDRHAFLLGRNGNGKSSVIEAIRWGLFGSTGRPNDIVANRGYGGRCRVEMILARNGKEWRLRRLLTHGAGGGSEAELFDSRGEEHRIRDVLPQMDSLDAGEGTHIIFAPQSAPLRRQPEDLTPFERTVLNHLGLTHARAMLSHLETSVAEHSDEESSLDARLSDVRKRVDGRIGELEQQRGRILESPPWDSDLPPSTADTERRVTQLIQELRSSGSEDDLGQLSLPALVDEAERAFEDRTGQDRTPLERELERLDDDLARLEDVRDRHDDIVKMRDDIKRSGQRLEQVLDGLSLNELRKRIESQRQEAETLSLRHRLAETAAELLDRTEGNGLVPCPICGTCCEGEHFNSALQSMLRSEGKEDSAGLRAMEDRRNEAQEIEAAIRDLRDDVDRLERELDAIVKANGDGQLAAAVKAGRIAHHMKSVSKRRESVTEQIGRSQDWNDATRARLSKLGDEAQYQQLQRDLRDLGGVRADMGRVQRAFEELVRFGESVNDVRDSVGSALKEDLRKKVVRVAKELTNVFGALTKHRHFDRLVIDEENLPRLELRVGSSSDPSGVPHPAGVLNGQAQSALALVPYFALSHADESPTEVYLVLLDDPTRAFDRDHIRILIERLADLGKRVQVIVGTQETEAFRELLPRSFARESYVIVEPKNWSYADGPELGAEYD